MLLETWVCPHACSFSLLPKWKCTVSLQDPAADQGLTLTVWFPCTENADPRAPSHCGERPIDFNRLYILPQISTHSIGRTSKKMCEIGSAKKAKISSLSTKIEHCYSSRPICFPSHSAHILSQVFEWCKSTYHHRSIRSHSNLHQQKKNTWL